jgi:cysteinyl-tRNA synthetase
MTISLHDPATNSLHELVLGPLPLLVCGPTHGASAALGTLRSRVVQDVLARVVTFRKYAPDAALESELAAVAEGELGSACEPETLRYWSLGVHYRAPLSLAVSPPSSEPANAASGTLSALDETERRLAYLYAAKKRLVELPEARIINVQTAPAAVLATLPDALTQALERDLDTPLALAEIQEFAIAVNALCDQALRKKGHVNLSAVQSAQAGFATIEGLLGLGLETPTAFLRRVRNRRAARRELDPGHVDQLVAQRAVARAQQDFASADRLQAELLGLGVTLHDGPEGSTWTLA